MNRRWSLKKKNNKILIIGAGGLGSPIAIYLSALGVGKIGIVDKDKVELSESEINSLYNNLKIRK